MSNCLITLKSATFAMKAKKILSESSILSSTVKLDSEYTGKGCTHGIRIDCRHKTRVELLLKENGVPYSNIIIK